MILGFNDVWPDNIILLQCPFHILIKRVLLLLERYLWKICRKRKTNKEVKTLEEKPLDSRSHWQFISKVEILKHNCKSLTCNKHTLHSQESVVMKFSLLSHLRLNLSIPKVKLVLLWTTLHLKTNRNK